MLKGELTYKHFLKVHHILFNDFYPWAGQDRLQLGVSQFEEKGSFQFEVPSLAQRAVEWGLEMGNNPDVLTQKQGAAVPEFHALTADLAQVTLLQGASRRWLHS